jgi:hypothetical protein
MMQLVAMMLPSALLMPSLGTLSVMRTDHHGLLVPVMSATEPQDMSLKHLTPSPALTERDVITSVMHALHRSNCDSPSAFYGFEIALRFLAPTHAAKLAKAKPAGFSRYMRQPHKASQISFTEYRFEGPLVNLQDDDGRDEAYQMVSMRDGPSDEWHSARFKLVKVEGDFGSTVLPAQWMVDAVFANEPDTPEDIEYLKAKGGRQAEFAGSELSESGLAGKVGARNVVDKVMRSLRDMNEPTPLHGAVVATRYCSPINRASELPPEVFAGYLEDPWYAILVEWDEMQFEEDVEEVRASPPARTRP